MKLSIEQREALTEAHNTIKTRLNFCTRMMHEIDSSSKHQLESIAYNYIGFDMEYRQPPTNGKKLGELSTIHVAPVYTKQQLKESFEFHVEIYKKLLTISELLNDSDEVSPAKLYSLVMHISEALKLTDVQFKTIRDFYVKHVIKGNHMVQAFLNNNSNRQRPHNSDLKIRRLIDTALQLIDYDYIHLQKIYKLLSNASLISPCLATVLDKSYDKSKVLDRLNHAINCSSESLKDITSYGNQVILQYKDIAIASNGKTADENINRVLDTINLLLDNDKLLSERAKKLIALVDLEHTRPITNEYILWKAVSVLELTTDRLAFDAKIKNTAKELKNYFKPVAIQQPFNNVNTIELIFSKTTVNTQQSAQDEKEAKLKRHLELQAQKQRLETAPSNVQQEKEEEEELPTKFFKPELILHEKYFQLLQRFTDPIEIAAGNFKEQDIINLSLALPCVCSKTKNGYMIISISANDDAEDTAMGSFGFHRQHRSDVDIDRGVLKGFHKWLIEQQFIPANCITSTPTLKMKH